MERTTTITNEDMAEMAAAAEGMAVDLTDIDTTHTGDQDILNGFLPLGRKLKAKLLKQNIEGVSLTNKQVGHVRCKFMKAGKFTIIELARNGKHYHGLSSRANCDNSNWFTGVAVAFNRAFDSMVESEMLTIESKNKEFMKKMLNDATCGISGKNKICIVRTPFMHDDLLEAISRFPPAVGPIPPYLR